MKILLVTHKVYPEHVGGREKYVVRLAEEWRSRGHSVGIVCYTRGLGKWKDPPAVRLHQVRWFPKPLPISQVMLVMSTVLFTLIYRYEIIYVNSYTGPQLAGFLNKFLTHRPYVIAIHNPRELFSKNFPTLSYYVKRAILQSANHVIAVSREIVNLLQRHSFASEDKVSYVPPGVEQELLDYEQNSRAEEENASAAGGGETAPLVITSRRLVKEKGLDVLLKAIKALKDDGFSVKCVIIGTGPELHSLAQLSEDLGIKSQVTFTGLITDEELKKLIASADCCVMPSRREGTPVALFEYMALGKPVVATRVGGIADVLPDKELIVPANKPSILASKIKMLLENEAFAARVGTNNRRTAEAYVWSRIAARISGIFRTIVLDNARPNG